MKNEKLLLALINQANLLACKGKFATAKNGVIPCGFAAEPCRPRRHGVQGFALGYNT